MTAALQFADPDLLARRDLTVDDVAHLPEDLRYELVHGRLVLAPSAKFIHGAVGIDIGAALKVHRPAGVVIGGEQSVALDDHNERRPDVAVAYEEGADVSPVLAADVLLVVEIISPSSIYVDREDKLKAYAESGIPIYWIVDLVAERVTLTEFLLDSRGVYHQEMQTDQAVVMTRPWETALDLPAWTAERDRIRRVRRRR